MQLVIAEKPSVGVALAKALGVTDKKDGYIEGNGYIVSWCVGHLVSLANADIYDEKFKKWDIADLPIIPDEWQFIIAEDKDKQFGILRQLMDDSRVTEVVNACDAGREGELIFRLMYNKALCTKPIKRLWISSMEEKAIRDGFSNLRDGKDYENLYQSDLCRAKADWIVGINATRLFSKLYNRTLNVGRVQTPTLAMLYESENSISNFQKEKYFNVHLKSVFFDAGAVQFLTDVPVRIDLFRMFKNHPVAGGASDLNFAPSGEIGSEVVHCLMREDEGLFHGLILLHDSAWKFILFAEQSARWGALNGVLPCGIIKIRIGKPGNFQTRVIMFPVPQSVKGDRAVMEFPGGIGFCREMTVDENVADQLRPVSPRGFVKAPGFGGMAVVPSVAEENRNRVFSRLQKPGYIIVDIGNALVILCDGRRKNPVVDLFPVDIEFHVFMNLFGSES